jgi:hypothetical protein
MHETCQAAQHDASIIKKTKAGLVQPGDTTSIYIGM